jgi:hypothetical protein
MLVLQMARTAALRLRRSAVAACGTCPFAPLPGGAA